MRLSLFTALLACGLGLSRALVVSPTSIEKVSPHEVALREIAAIFPRAGKCRMISIQRKPKCNEDGKEKGKGKSVGRTKRDRGIQDVAERGYGEGDIVDESIEETELEKRARGRGRVSRPRKRPTSGRRPKAHRKPKAHMRPKSGKKSGKGTKTRKGKKTICKKPKFPLPPKRGLSRGKPILTSHEKARSLPVVSQNRYVKPSHHVVLEDRAQLDVTMGEVKSFTWTAEDYAYTNGLHGCNAIGLMNKNHIVWAHFQPWDTTAELPPKDHRDTHARILGDITAKAQAAGILDTSGKAKHDTYAVIRAYYRTWEISPPAGIDSPAQVLANWLSSINLGPDKYNFNTYKDNVHECWISRVRVVGGWRPEVLMA